MKMPTRREVLVDSGVYGPDSYNLSSLPPELMPLLKEERFNNGHYSIVERHANAKVYFYAFNDTMAASKVNAQTIDDGDTHIVEGKHLEDVLPRVINEENTPDFRVPWKFSVSIDAVELGKLVGKEEMKQHMLDLIKDFLAVCETIIPQLQPPQPVDVKKELLQMDGTEPMRNNVLIDYLQKQYGTHLEIDGNEASSGKHFYSRFYRSKEDFYMKCKENDETEISAMYVMEVDELEMDTGDCKDVSKKSDKFQVMAYMTRAAADVALLAVKKRKLFKRINIYASLIDYTSGNSTQNFKMVFDFLNRRSTLYISSEELSIAGTFRRAAHILMPDVY